MVLNQLIKVPIRITCNTFTLIDHVLASSSEKVVQAGITETSLSDIELLFCSREKIKTEKPNKHNYLITKNIRRSLIIFKKPSKMGNCFFNNYIFIHTFQWKTSEC